KNIKKAAELTDAGFAHILKYIKPGMKEIDVALELEFFIRKNGGKGVAFSYIVASGERGAMPHGVASDKVISPGDLVTFDFGTSYNGYRSDMTRTIGIGDPSPKMRELYSTVLEAQLAGLQAIKAGIKCVDADAAARNIIKDAGYGEYFGHSLGHGVGLAIHEGPRVSQYSEEVLEAGMVVTCEPGIYIPNEGGVRIEDLVIVRENGCEILSHSPKELIVIE
ncbi:MAG: aminopeptidase P family protein, partial [Candidatus Tectomicrobia bacterium]|nr:aminopeptidase P family protein [Candidatus Tectomicrobia bacterium]